MSSGLTYKILLNITMSKLDMLPHRKRKLRSFVDEKPEPGLINGIMKDANSNEIKFCGSSHFPSIWFTKNGKLEKCNWNLCPNRFESITRPTVLKEIYDSTIEIVKYPKKSEWWKRNRTLVEKEQYGGNRVF